MKKLSTSDLTMLKLAGFEWETDDEYVISDEEADLDIQKYEALPEGCELYNDGLIESVTYLERYGNGGISFERKLRKRRRLVGPWEENPD